MTETSFPALFRGLEQEPLPIGASREAHKNPVHSAAFVNDSKTVKKLLSQPYGIGDRGRILPCFTVDERNSKGWTPLMYATQMGSKESVVELLKHDPELMAKNPQGETAMHLAIAWGHYEIAQKLLANAKDELNGLKGMGSVIRGIMLNAKDRQQRTPLHYAVRANQLQCLKWLSQQRELRWDVVDAGGETPLAMALRLRRPKEFTDVLEGKKPVPLAPPEAAAAEKK